MDFLIKYDGVEYYAKSITDLLNQVKTRYYQEGYKDGNESENSHKMLSVEGLINKLIVDSEV